MHEDIAAPIRVPAHAPVAYAMRSGVVESVHHGSVAVLGPDGTVLLSTGDAESACYPRSALKPVQATGMLRAGVELPPDLIALAAASHSGEAYHIDGVRRLLSVHGLGEQDLANTAGLPLDPAVRDEWITRGGSIGRLPQNCSGKHAAMLATARSGGWSITDYLEPANPVQQQIAHTVEELSGESIAHVAVDGCGAPLFALSLRGLTRAVGRIACSASESVEGSVAAAMRAHPEMVAGTSRSVTQLMRAVPGLIAKDGAEGVCVAAFADGTAIGVKIADGAQRARMPVTAAALVQCGVRPSRLADVEGAHPSTADGVRVTGALADFWGTSAS